MNWPNLTIQITETQKDQNYSIFIYFSLLWLG